MTRSAARLAAEPPLSPSRPTDWLETRAAFAVLLAIAAVTLFAGLGLRDPWPADEPRFAQVAREMVHGGNWLFPMRGGELYSDKPPIFMWSIAALYRLTGEMRIAFLLPSMLAAVGTLVLTHDIARRLWNLRTANIAMLLLFATLQFGLQARTAQIDMLVCFFIACGTWGLLRHLILGPALGGYLAAWFAMGLGIITKGVGFLPVLMLLPWAVLAVLAAPGASAALGATTSVPPAVVRPSFAMLAGPLALLAAVALWLVPMWFAVESSGDAAFAAYRDDILFRQTGERFTDSWSHLSPWWYFPVAVIPLFWLPLSALLPWLIAPWVRAVRARDPRIVLPLAWVALVVVFFSSSPGKRGVYVLPALPMLALAAAPYVDRLVSRTGVRRVAIGVLGTIAALLALVAVAGLVGADALAEAELQHGIRPWAPLLVIGLVAITAAALAWLRRPALAWLAFVVPFWLLYGLWGYPIANPGRTPALTYDAMLDAVGDRIHLAVPDFREQWLLFAPVPVTHFGYSTPDEDQRRALWRWLAEPSSDGLPRFALVSDRMPMGCFDLDAGLSLGPGMGRNWTLLSEKQRLPDCPAPDAPVPRFAYSQEGVQQGALGAAR